MSKKTILLSCNTTNTPFEEIFNILNYSSANTKLKSLNIKCLNPLTFEGVRVVSYPILSNVYLDLPDNIEITFEGSVTAEGKVTLTTYTPVKYNTYVKGKETVMILPDKTIKTKLSYVITPLEEDGLLGAFKNRAYYAMTTKIEDHVTEMYKHRRQLSFSNPCSCSIKCLDELCDCLQ